MMTAGMGEMLAGGTSIGIGMGGGFFIVRWIAVFLTGRLDKREAHIDAGTQRLIDGLERRLDIESKRYDALEEEMQGVRRDLELCKQEHIETKAELVRLQATAQGLGDARQHAALIVAAEKVKPGK
jgi:predicted  nucleic acid-binding Zn-ribbon protein